MQRLGKVLFGVLCMILLFTFSHAVAIDMEEIVPSKKSKIAWDATTTRINDKKIKNLEAVGYNVYFCDDLDKECKEDETQEPHNKTPIRETHYPLPRLDKGKYIVGVRALLYRDAKLEGKPLEESKISWSCDPKCIKDNPFFLKVGN